MKDLTHSSYSVFHTIDTAQEHAIPTSIADTASTLIQDLVAAALSGAGDAHLLALLGRALTEAGLDVPTIEVACDVVDPVRELHVLRWDRDTDEPRRTIRAQGIFGVMLERGEAELRVDAGQELLAPFLGEGATDAVAFATHLEPDATLGFFDDVMSLFLTTRASGFADREVDLLRRVTPVFGLALGARLNAEAARVLLGTYLGGDAATAMLDGRVGLGAVEQIRAVVIYIDLAGFTTLTERLAPQALINTLNLFFETVTRPVRQVGGQVSGYVGDAVVMFLRIADTEDERPRCAAAVEAVLEGLEALDRLNASPFRAASPALRARVGLDVGEVVYGNIGAAGRFSFTIIGTPVNRAARLQALAKDLDAALLMPDALAEAAGVRGTAYGEHVLRGLERPVRLVGVGPSGGVGKT